MTAVRVGLTLPGMRRGLPAPSRDLHRPRSGAPEGGCSSGSFEDMDKHARDTKRLRTALQLVLAEVQNSDADYASIMWSAGLDAPAMIDPLIALAGQFLTAHCAETGDEPVKVLQRLLEHMDAEVAAPTLNPPDTPSEGLPQA